MFSLRSSANIVGGGFDMRSTYCMVAAALCLPGSACAKQPASGGWEIIHTETSGMCTAVGQEDDKVQFGLAAIGSDFVLDIWASDFPKADASYEAMLSFDGGESRPVPALGKDGLMEISMGRGEIAAAVTGASEMTIAIMGHAHRLSLKGAAAGLDAAARCAGQPTLAEAPEKPAIPIPGAGDWTLYETFAGEPGRACMAHLDGEEADTMLQYDDQGKLILTAGNRIWAFPPQDIPMHISLDRGPDLPLPGKASGHVIDMIVDDANLVQQLRSTHVLDWVTPRGSLRSDVTGLGVALDAVERCRRG
jgi:hypothetical protein